MAATLTHRLIDNWLTQDIIASVQQVWQAGVGACMAAETAGWEGFSALIRRGEEEKAQASHQAEEVIGRLQERFETIQADAFNNLNKLEQVVQEQVMWGLHRLGLPSRKDIQHLARRVEALQQRIDELIRLDQIERTATVKRGREIEARPQPAPFS
jgi:poly(hydroxyalkanoate) granule-associated protein